MTHKESASRRAIEVLIRESGKGEKTEHRLDAALALLPYQPDKAIPLIIKSLEEGNLNNAFTDAAVDSLSRYLTPSLLRRSRRILKKDHSTRWALRLISVAGNPADLDLMESYFLSPEADAYLIPILLHYGKDAAPLLGNLMHYSALKSCIAAKMLTEMGFTFHYDDMERYAGNNLCLAWTLASVDAESGCDIVLSHLASDKVETRRSAAYGVGRLEDSTYLPVLVKLLRDEDSETACNAAFSLGFLGDTSGAELLRETAKDTETFIGDNARTLFPKLPDALVEPVLYHFLESDHGKPTLEALDAAGTLKDSNAVDYIIKLLSFQNPAIQRAALDALGDIGLVSTRGYVRPFLDSSSAQLRVGALLALGKLKDIFVVPRLNLMLFWEPASDGMWIRHPIVDALTTIGSKEALPALALVIDDNDPFLTLKVLDFFAQKAGKDYIEYVEPALEDSIATLRIKAAAAILAMSKTEVLR
ncbi:HEAT repeat domain-containing protein [candidate division WOR-3 bacterium]|nr:HEAT repeat domain-containing protein [candidate division WOR-3 bacterium]